MFMLFYAVVYLRNDGMFRIEGLVPLVCNVHIKDTSIYMLQRHPGWRILGHGK
jgi:hypothetical protein